MRQLGEKHATIGNRVRREENAADTRKFADRVETVRIALVPDGAARGDIELAGRSGSLQSTSNPMGPRT